MPTQRFRLVIGALGAAFAVAFCIVVLPPLARNPDVIDALVAGFVNPYAAGYALDTITCWLILAVWVWHEARAKGVRHGWVAVALGAVPGVATGLAAYLLIRGRQLKD